MSVINKNIHYIHLFFLGLVVFCVMATGSVTKVFATPCMPGDPAPCNYKFQAPVAPANTDQCDTTGGLTNPVISTVLGCHPNDAARGTTFTKYFITIWRALIVVGALATLFALINGALEWITAGGQKDKVSHGRQKMTEALVGMVILAGSFAIINFISTLFGLNLLKFTLPTPGNSSDTSMTPQ